nr:acyltransferase [Novosphingobium sp. SG720]
MYLDGWRGLAILVVLAGHFVPGIPQLGGMGVDLFFVLSGRLMSQILIDEKFPLKTFFLRRFSRIYPALLVFATVIYAVSMAARWKGHRFNSLVTPMDYFATLTMWMNYKVAFFGEAGALNHIWSISVEEHSYIILAILAALLMRRRAIGYLVLALAVLALVNGFVLGAMPGANEHNVFWRTDVRVAPLFLSFAIYLAPARLHAVFGKVAPLFLLLAFFVPFSGLPLALQLAINSTLLACAVNGLAHAPTPFVRFFEFPAMHFVGVTSYSIYLWQQPFYTLHERVTPLVLLPATLVVAIGSYYLIEQPARRTINRWIADRTKRPKPAPATLA